MADWIGVDVASVACRQCGNEITEPSKGRPRVYCGNRCSRQFHERLRVTVNAKPCTKCDKPVLGRGLCSNHYSQWFRAQRSADGQEPRPGRRTMNRTCNVCGKATPGSNGNAADGLVLCQQHRREKQYRNRCGKARRKLEQAARGSTGKITWIGRRCKVCNSTFVNHTPHHACCSDVCITINKMDKLHAARQRRRARKSAAFVANVSPREVFEADGYRCHLCRRKTNPTKQVPHPRAPTIDHIIPLSKGGTHEPMNCRTACFLCNADKRELGGGEQFALAL